MQIFDKYEFLINDFTNTINVYDLKKLKCVYSYKFCEKIINYKSNKNTFLVLTENSMYNYIN